MTWRGVLETAVVVLAFVGFGLGWAAAAGRSAPAYPSPPMDAGDGGPELWLIDGFNVLHAGPLGGRDRAAWWSEPRRSEILAIADRFDDPDAEIWVVFDGPHDPPHAGSAGPGRRLHRVFAPCADDWLLARLRRASDPARVAIVTADRRVADRARHRGARVVPPRAFLARCTG